MSEKHKNTDKTSYNGRGNEMEEKVMTRKLGKNGTLREGETSIFLCLPETFLIS